MLTMTPVVLLSQTPDKITRSLSRAFSHHGGTTVFSSDGINLPECGADYAMVVTKQLSDYRAPTGVLLLYDPPACTKHIRLSDGIVPVLLSDSRRSRRLLRGCQNPAICCSMSSRDTLTLSSISSESALVCVQRSIELPCGELEEGEIAIELSAPCSSDIIMLTAAAMLACGITPPDSRFII